MEKYRNFRAKALKFNFEYIEYIMLLLRMVTSLANVWKIPIQMRLVDKGKQKQQVQETTLEAKNPGRYQPVWFQ